MAKGSRGGTSGGATGGAGGNITATRSLISERERFGTEVDQALSVLRDIEEEYDVSVEDMLVSTITGRGGGMTLGYYDWDGNVAINEQMFTNARELDRVYDNSVKTGFHPGRGNKTGLQAVIAHELGHRLNYVAGGGTWDKLDSSARTIIQRATRATGNGNKTAQFRARISGYAKENDSEAVAESFADVYLNGANAKAESKAVYNELRRMLGR